MKLGWSRSWYGLAALVLTSGHPASPRLASPGAEALRHPAPAALVFDDVTVVDVEQGRLLAGQRVVIVGNRIQAVGSPEAIPRPAAAKVVAAGGKYLIPGLWDLHVHSPYMAQLFYPLLLANGVTGMRDAGAAVPLATLLRWRREVLAGTRTGPPRQILSGPALNDEMFCVFLNAVCPANVEAARAVVDSLKTAGADMIKHRALSSEKYAAVVAEARRVGLPSGGHMPHDSWTVTALADSGVRILDHLTQFGDFSARCWKPGATIAQCQLVADHFRQHNTWWVPTLIRHFQGQNFRAERAALPSGMAAETLLSRFDGVIDRFWVGVLPQGNWLGGMPSLGDTASIRLLSLIQQAGVPVLTGTDADVGPSNSGTLWTMPPGFSLHMELALFVAEGLTPLAALQAATVNPAKMWQATDSLGTVAAGKLADLVLLDANPLADITNTTTVRAVVANGRYYDRDALDRLLAEVQVSAVGTP